MLGHHHRPGKSGSGSPACTLRSHLDSQAAGGRESRRRGEEPFRRLAPGYSPAKSRRIVTTGGHFLYTWLPKTRGAFHSASKENPQLSRGMLFVLSTGGLTIGGPICASYIT